MAKRNGLKFDRPRRLPINWVKRKVPLIGAEFEGLSDLTVEAPDFWSLKALQIVARYYFYRVTKPGGQVVFKETSVRAMVQRVVKSITKHGSSEKYFSTIQDQKNFAEHLEQILLNQRGFFNSPVWFNCGLKASFKVKGEGTLWRYDEKSKVLKPTIDAYENPQVSACFILSVKDELSEVFDLAKKEAMVFRYGSGSGVNFSHLKGKGESSSRSGQSHGLLAFLDMLDRGAGALRSGGTSRRAAKMVTLDVDHPDIRDFITWKAREEAKARVLIEAGFSGGLDGEAYRTVAGQNANLSVRVSDEFMKAVEDNSDFKLRRRSDGKCDQQIKARELLHEIATSAWASADPGLQFADTIESYNTCPKTAPIEASNPCSEFMFINDSACNLASLNLARFLDADGCFDQDEFCRSARTVFVAQEILVGLAAYPTPEVAKNSVRLRPVGLGFTNLGGFLMRLGIGYDTEEGRNWAGALSALMMGEALKTSAELAKVKGAFAEFRRNQAPFWRVLRRHEKALKTLQMRTSKSKTDRGEVSLVLDRAKESFEAAFALGRTTGFRNSQLTLIAPTGTIGLAMDCDTLGIEPDWALVHKKSLVGGGELEWVSLALAAGLKRQGYTNSDEIVRNFTAGRPLAIRKEDLKVFQTASRQGEIPPISIEGHLLMMAAVQPFLSGAISKTVNLPKDASVDAIYELFLRAWHLGLKSVAVYRDQSKAAQPLASREVMP